MLTNTSLDSFQAVPNQFSLSSMIPIGVLVYLFTLPEILDGF